METAQIPEKSAEDRSEYAGVLRYYELAKRAEWQVRDLPWQDLPPIPQYKGTPQKLARRRDLWRSVVTQQLQADELAVEMATQLFRMAPDAEAKLYYTTMVQDESRHTEAWLRLVEESGGRGEPDPYLNELARMQIEADTLEEKVVNMQVFYERLIIPRFRLIARSSRGTVLEDLCNRLTTDDGIHHGAGMAYEKVLLRNADAKTKRALVDAANRLLPTFVEHALWRPKERAFIGSAMRARDMEKLKEDIEIGVRLAQSLGLDVSDVQLPIP
jgi:1,2-phenylacetyl-CoA epoxidase catalytic subunit